MEVIFMVVGIILIRWVYERELDYKVDNYPLKQVNTQKIIHDAANGVSVKDRQRRLVSGYYDDYTKR